MNVQKDVKFCFRQSKTLHAKKAFFVKLPEKISQQDRKETFITAELGNPRHYWRQFVNDAKQNMARDPLMSIYKCTVNPVSINVANK